MTDIPDELVPCVMGIGYVIGFGLASTVRYFGRSIEFVGGGGVVSEW